MPRELGHDAYQRIRPPLTIPTCQYYHLPFAPLATPLILRKRPPPTTGPTWAMLRHPPCSSRRLLQTVDARIPGIPPADPPSGVSSDVVVILAALLCALICVVGLVAVARCARSRRNSTTNHSTTSSSPAHSAAAFGGGGGGHTHATPTTTTTGASGASVTTTASKGLKKKALKALPKLAYADAVAAAAAARGAVAGDAAEDDEGILPECAICLSEFGEREEVRVMPQCGHGFHVACVDTWLRSNSSCPSCRRPIVLDDPAPPKRCRKCDDLILEAAVAASTSSSSSSAGGGRRGRGGFLP